MRARCHSGLKPFGPALLAVLALAAGLTACGGSGGSVGPGDAVVASVTIAPAGLTLPVGGQGSLTADVRNAAGDALPNAAVGWSSQNAGVASVAANGTVSGNAVGLTQVIAASGEKADTVDVIVIQGLTLEIVPAAASVAVGGTVQFEVVARDGSGQVIASPPVSWASANTSVGTIDATGMATGVTPGTTTITAAASSVTSSPATLTVGQEAVCDGVESVPQWEVSLTFGYQAAKTNGDNHALQVGESGDLTGTLAAVGPIGSSDQWSGPLSGTVSIDDSDTDLNSPPPNRSTITGSGPAVSDMGLTEFILKVDLESCSFTFSVSPAVTATSTQPDQPSGTGVEPVAVIWGADPLGAWRQLGLAQLGADFEAHFVGNLAPRVGKDTYFPLGYAPLLWKPVTTEAEGNATVSYTILPKF